MAHKQQNAIIEQKIVATQHRNLGESRVLGS